MILNIKFYVIYAPLLIAMSQIKKNAENKEVSGIFQVPKKKTFKVKLKNDERRSPELTQCLVIFLLITMW